MTDSPTDETRSGPSRRQILAGGVGAAVVAGTAQLATSPHAAAATVASPQTVPADAGLGQRPIPTSALPDPLFDRNAFRKPPTTVRPWFRWWWKAPLDTTETAREVAAMAAAGFGGVEVGFVAGAWADDAQRANLATTLATAAAKGIKVDITMGAAWPLATPNTAPGTGLAQQELMYGRVDVAGGSTFSGAVPNPFDDPDRARQSTLVAVTAARVITRGPAAELLPPAERPRFGSPIKNPSKSTVLDPKSLVDISKSVSGDNKISWKAPKGDWILFAFWSRDTTQAVHNHFYRKSADAAADYLQEYQIGAENAAAVRKMAHAMFEDSLEVSAISLYWTPAFISEFTTRRGYAPYKYLPLFFDHGMTSYWVPTLRPTPDFNLPDGGGERVRTDYYRTLQDLYVDDHIAAYADWAASNGVKFRSQVAYGVCLDPIRSARELAARGGLPEDESFNAGDKLPWGLENPGWRFALDHQRNLASGAHQGGQFRVSTELGAHREKTFEWNLGDYQGLMAKQWAAGITLPIVHGFQYQTATAKWPGDSRFGDNTSESWNDKTFPQWPMWNRLTDYWARGTLVLECGVPRTDVAVYRDGFLTTAARLLTATDNDWMVPKQLFDGLALEQAGHSLQFIDPVGIVDAAPGNATSLLPDGPGYRALVIDEGALPADTAEALLRLVRRGIKVVFVGSLPSADTSYRSADADDHRVREAVKAVLRSPNSGRANTQADAAQVLSGLGMVPAASWSKPVQVYAQLRQTKHSDFYMIYNATNDPVEVVGSFASVGAPAWLELWDGTITEATQFSARSQRTEVPISLRPLETKVLAFARGQRPAGVHVVTTDHAETLTMVGGRLQLRATTSGTRHLRLSTGATRDVTIQLPEDLPAALAFLEWQLHVDEAAPTGTIGHDVTIASKPMMWDWRSIDGLQTVSGVGTYTGTMSVPSTWIGSDRGCYLDLGRAFGAIQVHLNGKLVAPDIAVRRLWDVTSLVHVGINELKIVLYSTLRNEVTAIAKTDTRTQETGLEGPVRLIPYMKQPV